MVSKKVFARTYYEIWSCLWRWALHRHPNKGKRWIKARYFQTWKGRDWVFACPSKDLKKVPITKLIHLSDTPIKRHVKIRNNANPFDPQWKNYFEERTAIKRNLPRIQKGKGDQNLIAASIDKAL